MLSSTADGTLKIKFQCPEHEIDGATFTEAFIGFSRLIWAVNDSLDTGHKVNVRIKATEPGSFVLNIELITGVLENIKNLFALSDAGTVTEVIAVVLGILKLSKEIGDKKAKTKAESEVVQQGGTANIDIKGDGNVITLDQRTINIYTTNPDVRSGIRQIAQSVAKDPEIEGIEIQDKSDEALFVASSQDWQHILESLPAVEEPETRIMSRREKLAVIKPSFDPKYVWDFVYMGIKISARVEDQNFWQRVLTGQEQFGAGDLLDVEMDIAQILDPKIRAYVNKQYRVTKIHDHEKAPQGGNLTLDM